MTFLSFGSRKKRKKSILFAGISATNFIQFRPIYEVLKRDPRIEIILSGMHQGKDNPYPLYCPFGIERRFIKREKEAKRICFDLYISPDFHLVGRRHSSSVQLFHTTSFRNFSISQQAKDFKHLFLIGPYMKRKFIELESFRGEENRFEEVGMPQTDALLDSAVSDLKERLKLDKSIATVLYAPVWAPIEGFLKDVRTVLETLASLEVNLLLKMHHVFYDRQLNKTNWPEYLNGLLTKNKNMRLVEDFDIVPYMRISDLLVSDVSAVVHQFSILDRPIVCTGIDVDEFQKLWPNLDRQAYQSRAVVEVSAGESLNAAVSEQLNNPLGLSRQRQEMVREYFYNVGSATKCAVSKIYRFLNLEE